MVMKNRTSGSPRTSFRDTWRTNPTSQTRFDLPEGQNDQEEGGDGDSGKIEAPSKQLDLDGINTSSTYEALRSTAAVLHAVGRRNTQAITFEELHQIASKFERSKIDLSDVHGFPYDAEDLDECIRLLARLQNSLAMQGAAQTGSTLKDIMEDALVDRSKNKHRYDIGEWIEVRGASMHYRLEVIEDVVRVSDEDGEEYQFMYETAVDHKLTEAEIRWPREGLRRIFGMGPWAWRQWAAIKLEHKLRFEEGHPDDLDNLDVRSFLLELWEVWLNDERNEEFLELYNRVGTSGQTELIHHIMSPFNLIHEVITNSNEQWDLEDAGISLFTYVSLLGSGFWDALVVFALQLLIPVCLLQYYISTDNDDENAVGTRPTLFLVLVYYLYKLNRDLFSNFYQIAGLSDSVNSRILSLRKITWDYGIDSLSQSLGYTVDSFMNTGYVCALYVFNMWILFNVSDPFELLGSVLFFEFLFDLDEEIAQTRWWDDGNRYLKAGVVSIILQNTIRKDSMLTMHDYMKKMSRTMKAVEIETVREVFEEAGLPEGADFLHGEESDGISLCTVSERVERFRFAESKLALQGDFAAAKPPAYFAGFLSLESPLFERHKNQRAWSQWEIILFAFPTPDVVPKNYVSGTKLHIPEEIADQDAIKNKNTFAPGTTRAQRFTKQVIDVLLFNYDTETFNANYAAESWWWFQVTRNCHAALEWLSYVLQICFPFITAALLVSACIEGAYCQLHVGELPMCSQ